MLIITSGILLPKFIHFHLNDLTQQDIWVILFYVATTTRFQHGDTKFKQKI